MNIFKEHSLVTWCESYTNPDFKEYTNTISNLAFFIIAFLSMHNRGCLWHNRGCLWHNRGCLWHNHYSGSPTIFLKCDAVLALIGLGSFYFHATQTLVGEFVDEAAMSVLIYYYTDILCLINQWHFCKEAYIGAVSAGWIIYAFTRWYTVFVTMFLCQIMIIAYMLTFTKNKICIRNATTAIVFGKLCWVYERYLYVTNSCPTSLWNPAYYLHSYWHIAAAMGHYWLMWGFVLAYSKTELNESTCPV